MAALLNCSSTRICSQWGGKRQLPFQARSRTAVRRATLLVRAEKSKQKVVAVLYKAGKAAENKDLLGCVENELGLREFLEDQVRHASTMPHSEYVVKVRLKLLTWLGSRVHCNRR